MASETSIRSSLIPMHSLVPTLVFERAPACRFTCRRYEAGRTVPMLHRGWFAGNKKTP